MGNIQPEITRIAGAKMTLGDYLVANGVAVAAGEKIDVLAGKLSDISSLTLESLSITTPPTQTEYTAGDSFNPAGMVVAANFSNGASLSITNYTCSPATLAAGDTAVTVSLTFGDTVKSVQQPVTVQEKKSMSYSGTHTVKEITVNGTTYTQYTITGSGTLTVEGTYENVAVWLCGGGANGENSPSASSRARGGAGAYAASLSGQSLSGEYAVTVGAGQGASSFGSLLSVSAVTSISGGSGGGGAGGDYDVSSESASTYGGGTGDGKSKYPFSDSATFQAHCAGGGGGAYYTTGTLQHFTGGTGGSNGGNGPAGSHTSSSSISGGSGGNYGGGRGGSVQVNTSVSSGSAATFYGSGGGGAGCHQVPYGWSSYNTTYGGAGYQGVVYIRVPA